MTHDGIKAKVVRDSHIIFPSCTFRLLPSRQYYLFDNYNLAMTFSAMIADPSFVGVFLSVAPPTLDEITEDVCPGGTHHKCLPYGDCYGFQDFCSSRNRAVNSCFPHNIAGDEDALLSWCQQQVAGNATLKSHPACKYACVDRFNITTLYQSLPSHNGMLL